MTINSLIILSSEGDIIVQRNFLGTTGKSDMTLLRSHVLGGDLREPVFKLGSKLYVYRNENALHFFASVGPYGDAMAAEIFLTRCFQIFEKFIKEKFTVQDIMAKQILVQELLEEMIDNGDIMTTDADTLKLFIESGQPSMKKMEDEEVTIEATKETNYRADGIVYKKNEFFVDANETLNTLFNSDGIVLHTDVAGVIECNCKLSGMPECTLRLNDRAVGGAGHGKIAGSSSGIVLDDASFHHCVKVQDFEKTHAIVFLPPDGKFNLMQFRITDNIKEPFVIRPFFRPNGKHRAHLRVNLTANYSDNIAAAQIIIKVPCPPNTQDVELSPSTGKARFLKDGSGVEWKISNFSGRESAEFEVQFIVGTAANIAEELDLKDWKRQPITAKFELPMFTSSGVEVESVEIVSREGYRPNKWMRSLTQAGNYAVKW